MSLTLVGTRLGQYEVLARLGEGGMGVVYRARDTVLDRSVALKLLPATYARDPVRQDDTITIAVDFVIHLRAPFATGEMLIGDRPALALGLLGILDTPLNRDRRV
jgi:serine/threonine protein kinase